MAFSLENLTALCRRHQQAKRAQRGDYKTDFY